MNKSSKEIDSFLNLFCLANSDLCSATFLASVSVSNAMNLSPAEGFSAKPVISTGVEGPALAISSPKSFFIVLIRPWVIPTAIGSPIRKVPFWIIKLAIPPIFLSNLDSITVPTAYLLGLAFNSLTSLIVWIVSNKRSTPSPLLADILINGTSPPQLSGVILIPAISS